ncbi:lactonase family protein [Priestia megaterium]|nr:lactonase family protein [Priestia megaterium]
MSHSQTFTGYVGTYTKGSSEGVYTFTLDVAAKKLKDVRPVANIDNPTYVNISKNNQYLYAVVKEGDQGGVAAYTIDSHSGDLTFINKQLLEGASPCYVSINQGNDMVLTANYHKGTVESYAASSENGAVEPASSIVEHTGKGPNKERQEKPHVHYADFTPDEKYAVVVDLGTDQIVTYTVDTDGKLTEASRFSTAPGAGPRHLTFHPNGKYAYVMTELSSEVLVLSYNDQDGSFTQLQAISTIPADFKENNQGSAIHLSKDGRFVYAGNRGHDTIAVFQVHEDSGQLTFVEWTSTEGNWPRDFVLDPTEQFVIASNQETGNLVLFERSSETGKLTLLDSSVDVPYAVCVKFLNQ